MYHLRIKSDEVIMKKRTYAEISNKADEALRKARQSGLIENKKLFVSELIIKRLAMLEKRNGH